MWISGRTLAQHVQSSGLKTHLHEVRTRHNATLGPPASGCLECKEFEAILDNTARLHFFQETIELNKAWFLDSGNS